MIVGDLSICPRCGDIMSTLDPDGQPGGICGDCVRDFRRRVAVVRSLVVCPRTLHTVALRLRVLFTAALDGLQVGEVRPWQGLPSCPWPRVQFRGLGLFFLEPA